MPERVIDKLEVIQIEDGDSRSKMPTTQVVLVVTAIVGSRQSVAIQQLLTYGNVALVHRARIEQNARIVIHLDITSDGRMLTIAHP